MNKSISKILVLFSLSFISLNFLFINVSATTVNDTSVGAEVGDIYTYVAI